MKRTRKPFYISEMSGGGLNGIEDVRKQGIGNLEDSAQSANPFTYQYIEFNPTKMDTIDSPVIPMLCSAGLSSMTTVSKRASSRFPEHGAFREGSACAVYRVGFSSTVNSC